MADIKNIEIIPKLPAIFWRDSKNLRLKALLEEPQAFYDSYKGDSELPDNEWKNRLQNVIDGKSWMVYARLDGKLIGMAGALQNDEDLKNGSATIYRVYVDPQFRASGVATLLMNELLLQFRNPQRTINFLISLKNIYKKIMWNRKKITSVHLFVTESQTSAVTFYQKIGFKTVGKETMKLGDGKEHIGLIMEKILF